MSLETIEKVIEIKLINGSQISENEEAKGIRSALILYRDCGNESN